MHRIYEAETLLHAAFAHQLLDRPRDVHEPAPVRHFKPQVLGERLHLISSYFFFRWCKVTRFPSGSVMTTMRQEGKS